VEVVLFTPKCSFTFIPLLYNCCPPTSQDSFETDIVDEAGKVYSIPRYTHAFFENFEISKSQRQLLYLDNSSFKLYRSHGFKVG
jgi:hypothetical protein